jgi:SIR2-like domain
MASEDGDPRQSPGLDRHLRLVIKAMREGRVVPFLGAGVNLCGRPAGFVWKAGQSPFLPSGRELADYLTGEWFLESTPAGANLLRVSQYVEVLAGGDWLYDKLHELFAGQYVPTRLHEYLASVPERLFRAEGRDPRYQLIVTTNWDDALEQAFDSVNEPYHLVWYVAEGDEHERGKFVHRPPGGAPVLVSDPSEYVEVSTDTRTVILKIHGAVDRAASDSEADSYVITEDDYIEYLTGGTAIASLVPVELANQLKRSHFLFLGYSLADWNLRVILNRIWREQRIQNVSWAIQRDPPNELDERFWLKKNVEIFGVDLAVYVELLEKLS